MSYPKEGLAGMVGVMLKEGLAGHSHAVSYQKKDWQGIVGVIKDRTTACHL